MGGYTTTLDEDLAFLATGEEEATDASLNAARILSYEKAVLTHWHCVAEKALNHLKKKGRNRADARRVYADFLEKLLRSEVCFESNAARAAMRVGELGGI